MSDHVHDENCDHEHEEEVFLVTDDNGVEREMVIVYTFESNDNAYAVLLDRNDPEADGVIFFRIEEENDEAYLVSIEDEEEWNRVSQVYEEIINDENQ